MEDKKYEEEKKQNRKKLILSTYLLALFAALAFLVIALVIGILKTQRLNYVVAMFLCVFSALVVIVAYFNSTKQELDKVEEEPEVVVVAEPVVEPVEEVKEEPKPIAKVETRPTVEKIKNVRVTAEEREQYASKVNFVKEDEGIDFNTLKRSFEAKLMQSDDELKQVYSDIKNMILAYKVNERMSWKHETFRYGRKLIAKISIRGKKLCLYTCSDPKVFENTNIKVEDNSEFKCDAETPTLYRIFNDKRIKLAEQVIDTVMKENEIAKKRKYEPVDFVKAYPYKSVRVLKNEGLIK